MMEQLLTYLAVAAAILAALGLALAQLRPKPDYCLEARRLLRDVLTVYYSHGRLASTYRLDGVEVEHSGVRSSACGLEVRVPTLNSTALSGRVRLVIEWRSGAVVLRWRP